jgi:hypothetical protein
MTIAPDLLEARFWSITLEMEERLGYFPIPTSGRVIYCGQEFGFLRPTSSR